MQTLKRQNTEVNSYDSEVHINGFDEKRQKLKYRLYKTTKPLLIISQIFLCAPMGIHKPKKDVKRADRLYRLQIIWHLGIYAILAACVYYEYTEWSFELPTVQRPLYFIEYLVYLIHTLEIIWVIYKDRDEFWNFKNYIIDFDRSLIDLKLRINYCDLQRFIRHHLCLILLYFICTIIIVHIYDDDTWWNFLRACTVYILPNIIIQISLVQYYALLFTIGKRSEKLYVLLQNLLNDSNSIDISNFRNQLHFIRSLYAKLEEFTKQVNDTFAFSILLVYFGSFVNISVNIFLLYKYMDAWNNSKTVWIAYSAVWTCMHIGKMFLILYYNQNIQNKKNNATVLLSLFKYGHQAVEPTLRRFILQLMSDTRSNVICGVVALNMKFITSLLFAVSTLFIFLVQYDITYEALTHTNNPARPNMN